MRFREVDVSKSNWEMRDRYRWQVMEIIPGQDNSSKPRFFNLTDMQ